jgi:hypothetical protein
VLQPQQGQDHYILLQLLLLLLVTITVAAADRAWHAEAHPGNQSRTWPTNCQDWKMKMKHHTAVTAADFGVALSQAPAAAAAHPLPANLSFATAPAVALVAAAVGGRLDAD